MNQGGDGTTPDRHARGLEIMKSVHGWDEIGDDPGDFFAMTVEHLFADVWGRDVLSVRERRFLLLGLLVGQGLDDAVSLQLDAALRTGELTPQELREIVIFLTHYAGWARGARLNTQVEELIGRALGD
ncbi:putative 4-carboxymuconolactone decarboxylase [Microtetraspora sp. NBRC 13810]|uniref:carboxymuconolactone decarboxylase family protein n=1 Tax=Microtetraspora sp. NBRC 13810 TaxID=3030990 RepID=UPI0024A42D36|nr:carboxymuconolactone decarboxylase family protein [Microtetraspora sp. NBRC 13810]GLW11833.1 putative 4-carboxymuconolactone decarboxylase [Microtetraspora sp. NBRC 13810]